MTTPCLSNGFSSLSLLIKERRIVLYLHFENRQFQLSGFIGPGNTSFGLQGTNHAARTANKRVPAEARGYDSSLGLLTLEKDGRIEMLRLKINLTPTYSSFFNMHLGTQASKGEGPVPADAREARNAMD